MMASFSGALGVESRPRMCAYRWIAAQGRNPTLAASEAASPLKPVFKDANDSEETLAIAGETCATVGDYCLSGHRSKKKPAMRAEFTALRAINHKLEHAV
jgi:hypothetical protein